MFDTIDPEALAEPRVGEPVAAEDVRRLPRLAAGAGLHAVLEMVEVDVPGVVDDSGLLEVVAGTERAVAALHAIQARALAELDARRAAEQRAAAAATPVGRRPVGRFTGDEVAARLRMAPAAGDARVEESVRLVHDLPQTLRLLSLGEIDRGRATAVVRATAGLDADQARAVDAAVAERAPSLPRARLRRLVAAVVVAVDTADAETRAERAAADTSVGCTPDEDAMATLTAHAPAAEVLEVMQAMDAGADAARAAGATEGAGRLRWSVLLGWARGTAGGGTGRVPSSPRVQVNVAATTLIGLDDAPAELVGYGPVPAGLARRLAADATWRRVLVDPATGVAVGADPGRLPAGATPVTNLEPPEPPGPYRPGAALARLVRLRHPTCCAPGCPRAATRCDLDHVLRYPVGPTCLGNLRPLCRRHHRMKHETAWTYRVLPGGAVRWTTPTSAQHDVVPEPLLPHPDVGPVARATSSPVAASDTPTAGAAWTDTRDTARLAAALRRRHHAPRPTDPSARQARRPTSHPPSDRTARSSPARLAPIRRPRVVSSGRCRRWSV